MISLDYALYLTAFILFVLAAANVNSPRLGLVPAGLACLTLTLLI